MTKKTLQKIDIFISSPGDVGEERKVASEVIDQLNSMPHIEDRYSLRSLEYEKKVPAAVGDTPQRTVDRYMMESDQADIFICILWSRMGTPVIDETGKEYQSGTEYEFIKAYQANQKSGRPTILLYRSMKGILPDADLKQAGLVQDFFKQFEGKDAEFKGLYKKYGSNEEFRTTLFQHIDKIISEQIRSESTEKLENTEIEPEIYDKLLKWLDKGIELYNSKRYDEAIPCFDKVLEIDPKYILALVYKGTVLSDLGRNGEAMPYFDKVLGIDPKNSYAWNSKGAALQMLKSYDEALICFNKAIEFDPSYVFPWYNKGLVLIECKKFGEAVSSLSRVIELLPDTDYSNEAKKLITKITKK